MMKSIIIFSINFEPKPKIFASPSDSFSGSSHIVSFFTENDFSKWKYRASFILAPRALNESSKASSRRLLNSFSSSSH